MGRVLCVDGGYRFRRKDVSLERQSYVEAETEDLNIPKIQKRPVARSLQEIEKKASA